MGEKEKETNHNRVDAQIGEMKVRRERRHNGQGLIEYAMIIVLVAVAVMITLLALGPAIGNIYSNIVASI